MNHSGESAFPARRNGLVLFVVVCAALAGLVLAFSHTEGPATKCERVGGQMLIGPGGETSCINPRTFLPMETYISEEAAK